MPTIFHVTHWKAGSQWIKRILADCVPNLIVQPKVGISHFLIDPILEDRVYPTVYVTKEQFDSVALPASWRRFVIIRDLRDTLISAYYSLKISHALISTKMGVHRNELNALNQEEGLIYLAKEWLPASAAIQKSWLDSNETILRYESLIENDLELLTETLLDRCELPVSRDALEKAILSNRFNVLSGGRNPGTEDIAAHARKGVSGDWRNHFTVNVKDEFKSMYGDLLVDAGYEKDLNW